MEIYSSFFSHMCILFIAVNQHRKYPLIIAANRDEYHNRTSQSMHFWPDHPDILAGRDLHKGGSWLGVNRDGRFCAVTNFRTGRPENKQAESRGEWVARYLNADPQNNKVFVAQLVETHNQYNPFNLIFGNQQELHVFCSQDGTLRQIASGFHSLSNGYIDQHWPKMSSGVQKLTELVGQNDVIEFGKLNEIMRDETKAEGHQLPDTGINKETEKHISSIFISGAEYGTRTTTYMLYSQNTIDASEFNYDSVGQVIEQQQFKVNIKKVVV